MQPTIEQMQAIEVIQPMPNQYQLVSSQHEVRNRHQVTILRFQPDGQYRMNGPRLIAIFQKNRLISIKNFTQIPTGSLPLSQDACDLAEATFLQANPRYAKGLAFLRIEEQERSFFDIHGELQYFPVLWVKFGHTTGSYNWVTIGGNGTVIEMEYDAHWDYFRGRRKTEMWDNDDWVLAREGNGPQLPSPNALA